MVTPEEKQRRKELRRKEELQRKRQEGGKTPSRLAGLVKAEEGLKEDKMGLAGIAAKMGPKLKGLGGKLKGAGGKLKGAAKAAAPKIKAGAAKAGAGIARGGAAAKGAALGGAAVGGAAVGAGLAGGAAAYGGAKAGIGSFWRISKQLFMAINILLVFSLLLHVYDLSTSFGDFRTRGMILTLFAVYAWLFIYSKHEQGLGDLKSMVTPLIISAVALIVPIILLNPFVFRLLHMNELIINILGLFPVWPIVIMFGMPTTKFVRFARVAYVLLVLLAFLPAMWHSISNDFNIETMQVGTGSFLYNLWENAKSGGKQVIKAIASMPGKVRKTAQQQIQYAVGDYYTGQVEDGKNQPIGIFLEDVKPVSTEFYADDTVIVWATLIARTLDPDNEITITASCYGEKKVGDELKKEKGDADPLTDKDDFIMTTTTDDEKYISCEFPPNFFDEGPKSIFINTEFNFETMSYVKAYLMNLETLRTMKREGLDPLDQYEITDKTPSSVSTNGPIALNMKTSGVPIGVSTTESSDIMLGLTLENMWPQGMIKEVNSIVIKIPESLEIVYCDHTFEKTPCEGVECEEGKYTSVYRIKEGKSGLGRIKNVAGYHSIACRLQVKDMSMLMGNYPLVSRYFKAAAEYVYNIEKPTAVKIKKAIGDGTGTTTIITQPKPASFTYSPSSSSITVRTGQQKAFSVTITNPGSISYGWDVTGVVDDTTSDKTSYVFSSDTAGQATVTFVAVSGNATIVEERSWNVEVTE